LIDERLKLIDTLRRRGVRKIDCKGGGNIERNVKQSESRGRIRGFWAARGAH